MKPLSWFAQRVASSYLGVVAAAGLMFVPPCNSDYVGHAGLGYFLMPIPFLIAIAGLSVTVWSAGPGSRAQVAKLAGASLIAFAVLSLGIAFLGAHAMNSCFARYANAEVTRGDWLSIWALLFPPAMLFVM